MTRGVGGQSPANVQTYLKGIDYPARKNDLLRTARDNGAPEEVMDLLQQLPGDEYGGPQDVMKAYGQVK
jgi:hypothetical protein